jgi:hypothetical protein
MSLGIGGFERGRKQGREEALTEVKQAIDSIPAATNSPPIAKKGAQASSKRRRGRPSSRDEEIQDMLAIIENNPDRDEHYCRNLFEGALREREARLRKPKTKGEGEADGKRWLNERSDRAWKGAQKILSEGAQ